MFLEEYLKYLEQYEKNAKRISVRNGIFKLIKERDEKKIVRSYGNYDLHFNIHGHLIQSVHFESSDSIKIVYGYDKNGMLKILIGLTSKTNALRFRSDFKYDKLGRIQNETVRLFDTFFDKGNVTKCFHSYDGLTTIAVFKEIGYQESEKFSVVKYFDESKRICEEKALRGVELVYWNRKIYSKTGDLVKEVSLDTEGVVDGVYDYMPSKNGLSMGYFYKSKDENYHREYRYSFNEVGHWSKKTTLNNGQLSRICERAILYH